MSSIAIDGPAGAGKSSIAKALSKRLGYIYIDTGAMYRAVALFFVENNVSDGTDSRIESLLEKLEISIKYEDGAQKVILNGEDVTGKLRLEEIGKLASKFSAIGSVREKLVALQRKLAQKENVVMDGRDIATTVLPNADVKIFLTAKPHTRALRRYKELLEKGMEADINDIEADIIKRDERDMNREISPLRQATDAYVVDSSDKDLDDTLTEILFYVKRKFDERS